MKKLQIPQIINDYNYWMLGVDIVNQLIAYYRPKIWYWRTWVPIFLHCLDILWVNLYVLYKEYNHVDVDNDTIWNHKHFLIEFVNSLICRGNTETRLPVVTQGVATHIDQDPATHKHFLIDFVNSLICRGNTETRMPVVTQGVATAPNQDLSIVHKGTTDKLVTRRIKPSLSIFDDELVPAGKESKYKYCLYLVLVFKNRKEAPSVEKRPWHQCNICNVHLYKDHFKVFHKKQYE